MQTFDSIKELLGVISKILIRCFIMGLLVLLWWWGAITLAGDFVYSFHNKIVPMTQENFYLIHYVGMLMTKAIVFLFFLFPYIAIRLVLRKL